MIPWWCDIPITINTGPVDSSGGLHPICPHLARAVSVFNPSLLGSHLFLVLCCSEFTVSLCAANVIKTPSFPLRDTSQCHYCDKELKYSPRRVWRLIIPICGSFSLIISPLFISKIFIWGSAWKLHWVLSVWQVLPLVSSQIWLPEGNRICQVC